MKNVINVPGKESLQCFMISPTTESQTVNLDWSWPKENLYKYSRLIYNATDNIIIEPALKS